jgi:hypothetical protein
MNQTSHSNHRRRDGRAARRRMLAGPVTALLALAPATVYAQHGFQPADDDGDDDVSQEMPPPSGWEASRPVWSRRHCRAGASLSSLVHRNTHERFNDL